jgi:uncharacterized membrane protein YphA (DoxX/SURF4 family)
MNIDRLITPWWALRVGLGAAAFLAGLDKFFNLLADWPGYLSPLAASVLPISASSFMHIAGVVEMAAGSILLAGSLGSAAMSPPPGSSPSRSTC